MIPHTITTELSNPEEVGGQITLQARYLTSRQQNKREAALLTDGSEDNISI